VLPIRLTSDEPVVVKVRVYTWLIQPYLVTVLSWYDTMDLSEIIIIKDDKNQDLKQKKMCLTLL